MDEGALTVGSFIVAVKSHGVFFMRFDGNEEINSVEYDV
jgi:hypothetical protein